MHGSELSVAGMRWTTAKPLPGPPEMRPTVISHEGTQLLLLTFSLDNKSLEITGPTAWAKETPFTEGAPTPAARSRAGKPWQQGCGPKDHLECVGQGHSRLEAQQRQRQNYRDWVTLSSIHTYSIISDADPAHLLAMAAGPDSRGLL